jgi:hypothetical protein
MDTAGNLGAAQLAMADVLRIVGSWPSDRVRELTRELAATLPARDRTLMAHELLDQSMVQERDFPTPGKGDLTRLVGLIPWPEGQPTPTRDSVREERVWTKYGNT